MAFLTKSPTIPVITFTQHVFLYCNLTLNLALEYGFKVFVATALIPLEKLCRYLTRHDYIVFATQKLIVL